MGCFRAKIKQQQIYLWDDFSDQRCVVASAGLIAGRNAGQKSRGVAGAFAGGLTGDGGFAGDDVGLGLGCDSFNDGLNRREVRGYGGGLAFPRMGWGREAVWK